MKGFLRRRVWHPLAGLLSQGLSPGKLAASVAIGIGLSIFPVFGATTLLCLIAAYLGRLNQPTVQLINYLAGPLQLLLLIPFIRLGEWLFNAPRLPLAAHEIVSHIKADTFGAMQFFWTSTWHAVVAWLLVVPLASLLLTLFLIPLMRRLAPKPLAGEVA